MGKMKKERNRKFLGKFQKLEQKGSKKSKSWWTFWNSRRYVVAYLAFCGFFMCYALRVNLSIAIVAMTELKNVTMENGTIIQAREFEWDSVVQGYVLSSFFYGYITTQLLGGIMGTLFGGKYVFGIGVGGTAMLTLLTPMAAKISVNLLIALRIVEGIFEGGSYPAMHAVWAKWAPPSEASGLVTVAFSGGYIGALISMPVCSLLASTIGWESIFYVFGAVGILWLLIWMVIVADSPEKDSKISASELKYIQESLSKVEKEITFRNVPWCALVTSVPVWAVASAQFAENWGTFTQMTELPKYMKGVLGFDLNGAGITSALPYLSIAIATPLCGQFADWLISRRKLTVIQVRKLCTVVGFTGQTVFLLLASFFASPLESTICFITAVGFGGATLSGFSINMLDIARRYAAVILGFSNTIGSIPGIISPIIAGYIVKDETDDNQWRIIFYITSGTYVIATIVYVCFASDQPESWSIENETPSIAIEGCEVLTSNSPPNTSISLIQS